jgi:hypothetical protein
MSGPRRTSRWPLLAAWGLIAGGGLAFVAALFSFGTSDDRTSSDSFQVLDVIADRSTTKYAVIYRLGLSGLSKPVTGVWIVVGEAPDKGAKERPGGHPVAIWRQGLPRIAWQAGRLRLIGDQVRVLEDAGRIDECSTSIAADWDLCLDPAHVTFARIPN